MLSGAIDLAAKSAGIIPGSPCREVDSSTVDNSALLPTTPIADAEPDSQLHQQNVPEVRDTHTHTDQKPPSFDVSSLPLALE